MKNGDKVTVIQDNKPVLVLLLTGPAQPTTPALMWAGKLTWSGRVFRRRTGARPTLYPLKQSVQVALPADEQGVTWALGWEGEAVNALIAGRALR